MADEKERRQRKSEADTGQPLLTPAHRELLTLLAEITVDEFLADRVQQNGKRKTEEE